jgi:nucleotide-binding universal stress UspA family protein
MGYATVLVGTDGSEASLRAVGRASEVAASAGASLIVICAYHPMTAREQAAVTSGLDDTRFRVTGTDAAREALEVGVRHAGESGATQVEGRLVEGDAVEALLTVVGERSVDLIVVGNRGINTLSGRLLGSVPSDVSHRAPCDVLIVHTTSGRRG